MRCPNCGSENCHYISSVSRSTSGFGFSRACCGTLLSGPLLGILCGLCGSGKTTESVSEYWVCDSCGRKFTQWEAENANRYRIEKFAFYTEAQAQSVVEPFKTEMGERAMNAYAQYIKDVVPKDNVVISNPPIEMKTLEDLKSVVGKVLTEKELVYMVFPAERLVVADKGLIIGNQNHGIPKEILHYKNYIYIGQSYITATSEEEARAIQRFLRKVYLNDDSVGVLDEPYIGVLSRLQKLDPENSRQVEHYSSQKEYEKYVKMVKTKVLEKLKKDDPETYQQYLKKQSNKKEDSDNWQSRVGIGAIVVFVIKIFSSGLSSGIIPAIVVLIAGSLIGKCLEKKKYGETLKTLPDFIRKVEEENKKENIKKTGNIGVDEYEGILQSSFVGEYETWSEPNQSSDENVLNDDFDPERDAEIKKERTILTVILIVVCIIAIRL